MSLLTWMSLPIWAMRVTLSVAGAKEDNFLKYWDKINNF